MMSSAWNRVCCVLAEMQKTEYMVFAGRQYFLGDKCQVTLGVHAAVLPAHVPVVGGELG